MFKLSDRVKETSATTGAGLHVVLHDTYGGFRSFANAIGDGNTTYYTIENGIQYEVGMGTYHASTNSISRDTVFRSSNNNNRIYLDGASTVFCTYPADYAVFLNSEGYISGLPPIYKGIAFPNGTFIESAVGGSGYAQSLAFWNNSNTITYDTDLTWNNSTNTLALSGIANLTGSTNIYGNFNVYGNHYVNSGQITSSTLQDSLFYRTSAGCFFHAYVDNVYDNMVALHQTDESSPTWKLGLKTYTTSFVGAPTAGYVAGKTGTAGIYADSENYNIINYSNGLWVRHKNQDVFNIDQTAGLKVYNTNSTATAVIVQGAAAQSAKLQEWQTYSSTPVAYIDANGMFQSLGSGISAVFANNNAVFNQFFGGKVRVYVDNNDSSAQGIKSYVERSGVGIQVGINGTSNGIGSGTNIGVYACAAQGLTNYAFYADTGVSYFKQGIGINTLTPGASLHIVGNSIITNGIQVSGYSTFSSGNFNNLTIQDIPVSISGHTHASSDITNFNSSVSGLLPVKNLIGISGIGITSSNNIFTIATTGSFGLSANEIQLLLNSGVTANISGGSGNFNSLLLNNIPVSISGHSHLSSDIINFNTSVSGIVSGIYAPLNSPIFIGIPVAPTAASGTNTTQIATTAFVRTEVANLINSAPSTLDTLNELATALGNDPNFATTVTNTLATKISGTGTINYIPKFSGAQSLVNSLITDNGSVISIGNTYAGSGDLLAVAGDITLGNPYNPDTNAWNRAFYTHKSASNNSYGLTFGYESGTNRYNNYLFAPNYADISFRFDNSANNEKVNGQASFTTLMLIRGDTGNVGIGTISPSEKLHVVGNIIASGGSFTSLNIGGSGVTTGVGTSGYLTKWSSSSTITSGIVYESGSNVGIGTTTPSGKLHIVENSVSNSNLIIENAAHAAGAGISLIIRHAGTPYSGLIINDWIGDGFVFRASRDLSDSQGGFVWKGNNGTSHMVLRTNSTGKLGLGTTTPLQKFDVRGNIYTSGSMGIGGSSYSGNFPTNGLIVQGNVGIGTPSPTGTFHVNGSGFIGGTGISPNATLHVYSSTSGNTIFNAEGTNGSLFSVVDNLSGVLMSVNTIAGLPVFQVNSDYSISGGRFNQSDFVISSGGRIGIGTGSPSYKLHVNGDAYVSSGLAVSGSLTLNGSGVLTTVGVGASGYLVKWGTNTTLTSGIIYESGSNVGIGTISPTYTLQVNGSFGATTKSFNIAHPNKPGYRLEYGSLESPYHGIRLTGKDAVVNGKSIVQLPEYIKDLVHDEDLNIQLTNIKHNQVLYIDDIDLENNQFIVKCNSWFSNNLEFFWTFTAVRKDVERLIVERKE